MIETLNYSIKLKEAMAEIKATLKKYDIAGHVVLHEPGFSEYLIEVSPSWSMLKVEGNAIRFRSKLVEDFGGDRAAQIAANTATTSLIRMLADALIRDTNTFEELYSMLLQHWDITHSEGIHTHHQEH